ncbi:hypothetical protein OG218_09015 [Kineococcus sp. NBC_00420]
MATGERADVDHQAGITAAVEEQTATTGELARTVAAPRTAPTRSPGY